MFNSSKYVLIACMSVISEREYVHSTVLSTQSNSMEQRKSDTVFTSLVLSSRRKEIYQRRLANLGQVFRHKSEKCRLAKVRLVCVIS